jgi:hypothetical protein
MGTLQQTTSFILNFEEIKKCRCAQQAVFSYGRPTIRFGHVVEAGIMLHELVGSDAQFLPSPSVDYAAEIKTCGDQRNWRSCNTLKFFNEELQTPDKSRSAFIRH